MPPEAAITVAPEAAITVAPEAAITVAHVALLGFPPFLFFSSRVACVGRPQEVSPCVERIHAKENDQKSDPPKSRLQCASIPRRHYRSSPRWEGASQRKALTVYQRDLLELG